MSVVAKPSGAAGVLQVRYCDQVPAPSIAAAAAPLGDGVLAEIAFGSPVARAAGEDPRRLRVALQPLGAHAPREVWTVPGPVRRGQADGIDWARDDALQFVALEVPVEDGIRECAAAAYRRLRQFVRASAWPHVLRAWNYFDAITAGDGDAERYRQFCIGRAEGMGPDWAPYPAATAIGRAIPAGTLQVYALTARAPGHPLENPRQVAAYRYPRDYGPQPPSFARAMRDADLRLPLMLSGTASVIGHASAHAGCLERQLEETCANLERLLDRAREQDRSLPERFGPGSALKVYLRDGGAADAVRDRLAERFPGAGLLLLHAEVCRRELLVEIDGFHGS